MKPRFPYLIIVMAALALGWYWLNQPEVKQQEQDADLLADTQYQMYGVLMRQFDPSGKLLHRIEARQAIVGQQQTQILQPKLITHNSESVWSISAQQAIAKDSLTELILQGHVKVVEHSGSNPLEINTEQLQYFGEQRRLYSAQEVFIQDGELALSGTGFEVNLMTQDYRVLNNVRGTRRP
jgi:LPS export ABC transporter protein LptC